MNLLLTNLIKHSIEKHKKYKLWSKCPNYTVIFSTNGNIWCSNKHKISVRASNKHIAIYRATELLSMLNDNDAVLQSVKIYKRKNKIYTPKKRIIKELKKVGVDRSLHSWYITPFPIQEFNIKKLF